MSDRFKHHCDKERCRPSLTWVATYRTFSMTCAAFIISSAWSFLSSRQPARTSRTYNIKRTVQGAMEVQPTEVQMGHISSSGAAAVGQQLNWSECREQEQEIYIQYNMSYYGIADSEMAQERMGLWCVAIYVVTVVASLVGNWGVVLTVLLNRSMRTTVNFYLSNLAFADALIAMFCMWTYLVKHFHDSYVLGVFMCRVEGFVQSKHNTEKTNIRVFVSV